MWWKIFYTALERNGWRQLFFYLSNLDVSRFIEFHKVEEFLGDRRGTILELGCGYSILPSILSNECEHYICLDLSNGACKYQSYLPNVSSVIADMQHLPFKDETIATILAISSIEHVPDDKMVFKEISRISKKDADVIIDIPYSDNNVEIKKMERPKLLLGILYKFKNFWKIVLGNHAEYFLEQTSTDSFMKYYNMGEINKLVCGTLCVEKYYLYEKWLQQKFFRIIPKGWFIFKDFIIGWIIWRIEDILLKNDYNGKGIIISIKKRI